MCLICVEIQKGQLSPNEFAKKVEMVLSEQPDHGEELIDALTKTDPKYLDQLDKFLTKKLIEQVADFLSVK
jgi:predicted transcriptional regulator